ncbi:MAG: hypothetical protein J7J68_05500 [Thermotogaceae bacterium]|nr:hypothetical protein [Thermotogaceae bacterium]
MKKVFLLGIICIVSVSFGWTLLEDLRNVKLVEYILSYEDKTYNVTFEVSRVDSQYEVKQSTSYMVDSNAPIEFYSLFEINLGAYFLSILNPAYNYLLTAVDLTNQETTKIMGFGTLKYEGTEKVGKWTGTRVVLYDESGEKKIEWVLNQNVPFALKVTVIEDQEDQIVAELVNYIPAE